MIKYLGSKRTLLPTIGDIVNDLPNTKSIIDLFSGTSRVGHFLKQQGYQVFSNDLNTYAYTLASCYVAADKNEHLKTVEKLIKEMQLIKPEEGYFTKTFCEQSRFFQPKNGRKVDAMRNWIENQELDWELKAILLVSLMEAADRVDSTCGVQMAYLKKWAPRAHNDLTLRIPNMVIKSKFGKSKAIQSDAFEASKLLSADVAYLDPPYNQHKYLGNYHIWETLVKWDEPEAYGIACKRIDIKKHRSVFNKKNEITEAMSQLVSNLDTKHIIVSFNNEGYIDKEDMIEILSNRGNVLVIEKDYKRYVGAQIGIHNPKGDVVGKVSHLRNKEFIFVVSDKKHEIKNEIFKRFLK